MNMIKALEAYQSSVDSFSSKFNGISNTVQNTFEQDKKGFMQVLEDSLGEVNALQTKKSEAIEDFASGKNNNVQDLMIAMQRASTAVQLTSAVRNKVLEMYREISRLPI